VAAKCSRLFYICRTRGRPVKLALELLISNSGSKPSVVPPLVERFLSPLIGNRTLRGLVFRARGSGRFEGHAPKVRDRAI
jgi:hypothetical protein